MCLAGSRDALTCGAWAKIYPRAESRSATLPAPAIPVCLGAPEGTFIMLSCAGGFGKVYKATLRDGMQVTSATASHVHIIQLTLAKPSCVAVLLEMYLWKASIAILCHLLPSRSPSSGWTGGACRATRSLAWRRPCCAR